MNGLSDEELVANYRERGGPPRGNPFLDELFGRHHRRVAAMCYRMTGDRESAADLAQEVFVKAFQYLPSFRGDAKFTTWLYTITRNHCLSELKARSVRPQERTDMELTEFPRASGDDALQAMEREESKTLLRDLMLKELEEVEAQVMTLHYGDEMPLDAITRLLQLTNASGAKAYIVSAKRKLNAAMLRWKHKQQTVRHREADSI